MNSAIQNHIDTYYSLLKTGNKFKLSQLEPSFIAMDPAIKNDDALNYAISRLPKEIEDCKTVLIGQTKEDFEKLGYKLENWQQSVAVNRRRRNYYQEKLKTLVCKITSDSDIDDLINALIAYQINYNKKQIKTIDLEIQLIGAREEIYQNIAQDWWQEISLRSLIFGIENVPIYFVFSNIHSLSNIIGGYVRNNQNEIFAYIENKYPELIKKWLEIKEKNVLRVNDFLYYISSVYLNDNPSKQTEKDKYDLDLGFRKIKVESGLLCNALIIPVSTLATSGSIDPYLTIKDKQKLANSKAVIINLEYPLGFSAYYIVKQILKTKLNIKAMYVQGKAAILSGEIGDIQLPKVVYDERTHNTIIFNNIFNTNFPDISFQSNILRNLKSVSVYGTFLENKEQLENYINSGFNIIEMEAGPYLLALVEHYNNLPSLPHGQTFDNFAPPFELGIVNYASDNPLVKNLGQGALGITGVEPTYLGSLTIVERIVELESA